MTALLRSVAAVAAVAVVCCAAASASDCYRGAWGVFKTAANNSTYVFDFSRLCSPGAVDYTLKDNAEHTYTVNILGNTSTPCLPGEGRVAVVGRLN